MLISELIKSLERQKERLGDVQVTMQSTLLQDGFSREGGFAFPDIFEGTVETLIAHDEGEMGNRVRLYWQI